MASTPKIKYHSSLAITMGRIRSASPSSKIVVLKAIDDRGKRAFRTLFANTVTGEQYIRAKNSILLGVFCKTDNQKSIRERLSRWQGGQRK